MERGETQREILKRRTIPHVKKKKEKKIVVIIERNRERKREKVRMKESVDERENKRAYAGESGLIAN